MPYFTITTEMVAQCDLCKASIRTTNFDQNESAKLPDGWMTLDVSQAPSPEEWSALLCPQCCEYTPLKDLFFRLVRTRLVARGLPMPPGMEVNGKMKGDE